MARSERVPVSEAHSRLGQLLRAARASAGATTRDVAFYSSGHISNVENGHVMPSENLVYYYVENFGSDERAVRSALEAARQATRGRREQQRVRALRPVTPESEIADIRRGYRVVENDASFRIGPRGAVEQVDVIREIAARRPGTRFVVARYAYLNDMRPGVLRAAAGTGCSIARISQNALGYLVAILELDRPVGPEDGPVTYSYRVRVDSPEPVRPALRYHAHERLQRLSLRVQFAPEAAPGTVWWFSGARPFDVEEGAEAGERIPANEIGFYHRRFRPEPGGYVGIAWEWQQAAPARRAAGRAAR
ncbi:hypothetical protein [Nocardiopsis coralliicola]